MAFYYHELGGDTIRALSYKESAIKNAIKTKNASEVIGCRLKELFPSGTRMATQDIKRVLSEVYEEQGIKKSAMATDLPKYGIPTQPCKVVSDDGSRKNGYQIL